uniref:AP-1 complex subunit gamma-2, putative n=1 Tax=Arundo donax TaxID=35708 RepID=A0A0A9CK65_ARUDO
MFPVVLGFCSCQHLSHLSVHSLECRGPHPFPRLAAHNCLETRGFCQPQYLHSLHLRALHFQQRVCPSLVKPVAHMPVAASLLNVKLTVHLPMFDTQAAYQSSFQEQFQMRISSKLPRLRKP